MFVYTWSYSFQNIFPCYMVSRDFTWLWTTMFFSKYGNIASLFHHSSRVVASTDDDTNVPGLFKSRLFTTGSAVTLSMANFKTKISKIYCLSILLTTEKRVKGMYFLAIDIISTLWNTGVAYETFQQSRKCNFVILILKRSVVMYESTSS